MKWYNSIGERYTFGSVIDTEVHDRENYTIEEVNMWKEKYSIDDDTEVMWVCSDKRTCRSLYCYDEYEPMEIEVENIIEESDDGDYGFLAYWK